MSVPFVVGAYASLPEGREAQEDYYRLLAGESWIDGIEIPYPGDLAENWQWLGSQIPTHWAASTITAIPGTMQNVWKNGDFGLASPVKEGRDLALAFVEEIRVVVNRLADQAGRSVVARVQVHSAPTAKAEVAPFLDSLGELKEREWAGAGLVIEHCDAPREGRKSEKGFLEIVDEIAVARELGLGIHLNWGRSCLEERDAKAPLAHVEAAGKAGVLAGLMFSGAGPEETQYGYAWIDGHLPASTDEPTSWMTPDVITECAKAAVAAGTTYLGAKICVPKDASLEQRLQMLANIHDAAVK